MRVFDRRWWLCCYDFVGMFTFSSVDIISVAVKVMLQCIFYLNLQIFIFITPVFFLSNPNVDLVLMHQHCIWLPYYTPYYSRKMIRDPCGITWFFGLGLTRTEVPPRQGKLFPRPPSQKHCSEAKNKVSVSCSEIKKSAPQGVSHGDFIV